MIVLLLIILTMVAIGGTVVVLTGDTADRKSVV